MKSLPISYFKSLIDFKIQMAKLFRAATGISVDEDSIEIGGITQEFQSDCDGDDNNIGIKVTIENRKVDTQKLYKNVCKNFSDFYTEITQKISGSLQFPEVTTICTFYFYDFK